MTRPAAAPLRAHHPDYVIALIIAILLAIGLVTMYSVSPILSQKLTGDVERNYYFLNQLKYIGMGLVVWIAATMIPYPIWRKLAPLAVIGAIVSQVLLMVPGLSYSSHGATRWLDLGFISLQPAELLKVALIFYLAAWFERRAGDIRSFWDGVVPFVIMAGTASFIIVVFQRDMGTMSVVALAALGMYFAAGMSWRHLAMIVGAGVAAGWAAIVAFPHRMERVTAFLAPEQHCSGVGYHLCQALIAIGSGGLFGLGLGKSIQVYGYLPEAANDSIFAIIAEEFGLIGALAVISLFGWLVYRGLEVARNAPDLFARLVATGIALWFLFQAFINIGAMVSIVPLTGIPLPFISYGGTSLIISLFGAGVLLNISKYTVREGVMRVVVSGGGSAGHISPTLATSDALKSLDSSIDLLYIGQADSMEARIVGAAGLPFVAIKAGKFRRLHSAGALAKVFNWSTIGPNARDAGRMIQGVAASLRILRKFQPDVVFLKGGFVCLPVGMAAQLLRIPYVIHESDLSPGLTNRILSRWATKVAVGFPVKAYHEFAPGRLVFTGNPIRPEIVAARPESGRKVFKLEAGVPTVLITGGSQGAAEINDVILAILPDLLQFCQVIHQTGEGEYERIMFTLGRQAALPHRERYHPAAFITQDMPGALAAADLIVQRAGANAIAESAILGKPTILIPNTMMAGHQVENARLLSRAGAARVMAGGQVRPALLIGEIRRILESAEERARMSAAIRQFAQPDAAMELARVIIEVGRAGEPNITEHDDDPDAAGEQEGSSHA